MKSKFVLVRKRPESKDMPVKSHHIRVSGATYKLLINWAVETNRPISEVASEAIQFASERVSIVNE